MSIDVDGLVLIVAVVAVAALVVFTPLIGDRIAQGRRPRRRKGDGLRAEDAGDRHNAGGTAVADAAAAAQYDRKRGDFSGLSGM